MILFDLDGTLTDSGPGITRCVQYALASFGIEEPDLEKLNCYVGPPLLESFMNFAGLGCEEAQQAITKYRERYEAEGIFENEVYEGIPDGSGVSEREGKKFWQVAIVQTGKIRGADPGAFRNQKVFYRSNRFRNERNQNRQRRSHRRDAAPTRSRRQPFRRGDGW